SGDGSFLDLSRGLEPMLEDFDFENVVLVPSIIGPHFLLPEAYAIQRQLRQSVAHLREFFRVRERAANALDRAGAAADVVRRAHVAERISLHHFYTFAGLELSFAHGLRPSCAPAPRW